MEEYNNINFERDVGFIWDIDGVVVDSPHEEAWRATLKNPEWGVQNFSSDFYFAYVASRPRYEGGNNILERKGIYKRFKTKSNNERRKFLERFCAQKNLLIRKLILERKFRVFESSIAIILDAKNVGVKQAAASASKNAEDMLINTNLSQITKSFEKKYKFVKENDSLYNLFDISVCGLDLEGGKLGILRVAFSRLKQISNNRIKQCIVFEDAPAGIRAAKKCGMFGVGILRIGKAFELWQAGADLVVKDLSEISYPKLKEKFIRILGK
jgi:beta-phosphoglucomutase-like phosphatase (HAD superfamily)